MAKRRNTKTKKETDGSADAFAETALVYHRLPRPGKLEVVATKPLGTQRDLALAYSPGVAAACEAIVNDPAEASTVTVRGNLVAVITNGTAVRGLGAIGPLASKPVMEGKAVLFKKFAGIDVFDIEVDETDPEKLIEVIAALEPTFGAINLEDIRAPECFIVERALRERMGIPVFHDDQHGTAIIVGAAIRNGLRVVGKKIKGRQAGLHRRRRRRHCLFGPAPRHGTETQERHPRRPPWCHLQGSHRGDDRREGGLCPGYRCPHPRPGHRRCRCLPWPVGPPAF